VTADGGGSNGYRVRLWKIKLQKLADELKFPRGVRKAVGIWRGAISGDMKVSFQAARSIG
jgi:hypothetical protein